MPDPHGHMVGQWVCANCGIPTPIEQTDGTRCTSCGLQMSEIKPAPVVITGIERELAHEGR